jgi:hypothetical protein
MAGWEAGRLLVGAGASSWAGAPRAARSAWRAMGRRQDLMELLPERGPKTKTPCGAATKGAGEADGAKIAGKA